MACSRDGSEGAADGSASSNAGESGRKILYWKSPMDPSFIAKAPGKDSMGMDLVPVYEGDEPAGAPGTVRIDPATIQNIGVKTARVERKALQREIRTIGRIGYDERLVRWISPKIGGWIERQNVNFPGQMVKRGERLLEIYSPELVSTQEEYLVALRYRNRLADSSLPSAIESSERLVRDVEARLAFWNIRPAQITALRERGQITRTMSLHAPFDGIVTEKRVPEGGYIQPGQAVYGIADISKLWVYADVYEYEAPWIHEGQQATMTLAYDPSVRHDGHVTFVYPYLKNKTRTLQVRIEIENTADFALKPDMWANVTLHSRTFEDSLTIPVQAVIRTGRQDVVLIALEGGRFEPRDVQLGVHAGDEFQVLEGLAEGERVVTSAQFLINSESNLQAAIAKMLSAESEPAEAVPSPTDRPTGEEPGGAMKMPMPEAAGGAMKMPMPEGPSTPSGAAAGRGLD